MKSEAFLATFCKVEEIILARYRDALQRLGVKFRHESFGGRSLAESASFKQRIKIFFCSKFQEEREEVWRA